MSKRVIIDTATYPELSPSAQNGPASVPASNPAPETPPAAPKRPTGMKALSTALNSMACIEKIMNNTPAKDRPKVSAWFKATYCPEVEQFDFNA